MNRQVNTIAGRLSLRAPQHESLRILDDVTQLAPPRKNIDVAEALAVVRAKYPSVTDFEREFPSLCFALATGVGKTRLMGAFIAYLHLAHGLSNFFVLAPNLTIYNKLIADFTPNTPKYVFKGISEFALDTPAIITGENYDQGARTLLDDVVSCKVNIFNISKINSEVRGGRAPRIKRLSEYIGESYFDYLAALPDLVLIMDESHRYRGSAGARAINELCPVLGLELTATPEIESTRGPVPFKNVIYDYPLGRAMVDGFVKEPAVVTRKNFDPAGMSQDEIDRMKLEDGLRLHEVVRAELETYATNADKAFVKPFVLVIARDTTHAGQLLELVKSETFFGGTYSEKVIQVDSSSSGAQEEEMIRRLLAVEDAAEPTEIVIHVNMLKEGWDVTNLYTIIPLRAANAGILVKQSIGRGLRLPYGHRTGVPTVDRLNIVAHDRFQAIVDESSRPDSPIRMQQLVLDANMLQHPPKSLVSQPTVLVDLGYAPQSFDAITPAAPTPAPLFTTAESVVAQHAYRAISALSHDPQLVPSTVSLQSAEVQAEIVRKVELTYRPPQLALEEMVPALDIAQIVAKTVKQVALRTIDIPRIQVVPGDDVRCGFKPFTLALDNMRYLPPSDELWLQYLRTARAEVVGMGAGGIDEVRLEDYIVGGLIDFNDIAYDDNADLLYDLAGQTVRHCLSYLHDEEAVRRMLRSHQRDVSRFIHAQMHAHYWEEASDYQVKVSAGFTPLKECRLTTNQPVLDFHHSPSNKSNMAGYVFMGFERCLYSEQKFQSESERKLAIILDREALKWFRPVKGQFQIFFRQGADHLEYIPDFVAETADAIYLWEPKAVNELKDPVVQTKRASAEEWCRLASAHTAQSGGKPWHYVLLRHDAIAVNMNIEGLLGLAVS